MKYSTVVTLYNNRHGNQISKFMHAYGFTYTPSNTNVDLSLNKREQIKAIQGSGLPFPQYIHQISIGAGNPKNSTAITDYKAIQKHIQDIEKLIGACDVKSDYIISSDSAINLCMNQSSFVYETCTGDHNIYASICNNAVIENILKTTKPSLEELNRRAYREAEIHVPMAYR